MSDTTAAWNTVVNADAAESAEAAPRASSAPAAASAQSVAFDNNLPPFPQGVSYMIGRLPIKCDTSVAMVQLPEPIKGVSCAVVLPNSGVLSDCHRDASSLCVPNVKRAYPINDREIKVVLDGQGDGKAVGPGWVGGQYPGAQPTTRPIETGVPYVEVVVFVGVDCGCDGENWAADTPDWG